MTIDASKGVPLPDVIEQARREAVAAYRDDLRRKGVGPCIFEGCVSTDRHWHGGFPGGFTNPADPEGAPIEFTTEPAPGVRDYNGALIDTALASGGAEEGQTKQPKGERDGSATTAERRASGKGRGWRLGTGSKNV